VVDIRIPKIVVIGGGTGSSIVLKGLKKYDCNLFAIVPMGDSGGSSGRLREELGILSAGEIRQRLIALAGQPENELVNLLDYRFEKGNELKGHNLGNLLIAGLTEFYGSQEKAIETLCRMVNAKGKIVPSTWDRFELVAEYENGKRITGEHFIDESDETGRISRLYTQPIAKANLQAIEAIKNADFIIFGPGDLYSSVLHNIVVDGIAQAIRESRAKKILICNLMTTEETKGMDLQDFIDEMEKYIGAKVIDTVVVNSKELPAEAVKMHENMGHFPVKAVVNDTKVGISQGDLLAEEPYKKINSDVLQRSVLRHNADKLGSLLISLIQGE